MIDIQEPDIPNATTQAARYRAICVLYDELLQYVQGLVLNFESANKTMTGNETVRQHLDHVLNRTDIVLAAARRRFEALEPDHPGVSSGMSDGD